MAVRLREIPIWKYSWQDDDAMRSYLLHARMESLLAKPRANAKLVVCRVSMHSRH